MTKNAMACRAMVTGRPKEIDEQGGYINFHNRRNSTDMQAREVAKRVSVSPAVARAIAALAFQTQEAAR